MTPQDFFHQQPGRFRTVTLIQYEERLAHSEHFDFDKHLFGKFPYSDR